MSSPRNQTVAEEDNRPIVSSPSLSKSSWDEKLPRLSPLTVLICLLALAIATRIGYMPLYGHSDIQDSVKWATTIRRDGLFSFYADAAAGNTRTYPPVSTSLFGASATIYSALHPNSTWSGISDPQLLAALKIFPVLAELLMIVALYWWLRGRPILRWLIPGALAVYPGLIVTSAFWGQNDSVFTLFIVLSLILLNRDKPRLAWLCFALAVLSKQQAAVLTPLILIVTFRRYQLRVVIAGILIAGLLIVGLLLPFALMGGLKSALAPYLNAADPDPHPKITDNALNLWYLLAPPTDGSLFADSGSDTQTVVGPLKVKHVGLLSLGCYTLIVLMQIWFAADQKREFVWAAVLYFGVFMFPTQIHERYLYPGAILALIALAQDRRMWLPALGVAYTYTYNVVKLAEPFDWLGIPGPLLWPASVGRQIALLNLLWLLDILRITLTSSKNVLVNTYRGVLAQISRLPRAVFRVAQLEVVVWLIASLVPNDISNLNAARWLITHLPVNALIVSDASNTDITTMTRESPAAQTWFWYTAPDITPTELPSWMQNAAYYALLTDHRESTPAFEQRISAFGGNLLHAAATWPTVGRVILLKEKPNTSPSMTFEPVTFDDSLSLIACYVVKKPDGSLQLYFRWYVARTPPADYHIFVHLIDPATGSLIGQADNWVGKGLYPTNTWHLYLTVLDEIDLPHDLLAKAQQPYTLSVGLYTLPTNTRATIRRDQTVIGDNLVVQLTNPGNK